MDLLIEFLFPQIEQAILAAAGAALFIGFGALWFRVLNEIEKPK